jgi:hypothetical protein
MILSIAGGSSMEFQTKKQKKDHLRLVNNKQFRVQFAAQIGRRHPLRSHSKISNWKAIPMLMQ